MGYQRKLPSSFTRQFLDHHRFGFHHLLSVSVAALFVFLTWIAYASLQSYFLVGSSVDQSLLHFLLVHTHLRQSNTSIKVPFIICSNHSEDTLFAFYRY